MNSAIDRARSERTRSQELKERSELLAQHLVDTLRKVAGRPFGQSGETFKLRVSRMRPAVALLRHDLGRWLEQQGVEPEQAAEITLACSEACANAVEHPIAGHGGFEVEAAHSDGEVVVVVRDSGHWRSGPTRETRGRGMPIIRALMTDVEVTHGAEGTEIIMRRRLE